MVLSKNGPLAPVVNKSNLYISGLDSSWGGAASNFVGVNISAGQCRDSTNTCDIEVPEVRDEFGVLQPSITVLGNKVGANGCDQAVIVADKIYALYVINDSKKYNSPAGLLSLDYEKPVLPYGYDSYRRVSWVYTQASIAPLPAVTVSEFVLYGVGNVRYYWFGEQIGFSTGFPSGFVPTSLSPVHLTVDGTLTGRPICPPINANAHLNCISTSSDGAARYYLSFAANDFPPTAPYGVVNSNSHVGSDEIVFSIEIPVSSPSGVPGFLVESVKSAGNVTLGVTLTGFVDFI